MFPEKKLKAMSMYFIGGGSVNLSFFVGDTQ